MFRRILVASRGETAMNIIRCCIELEIETILIHFIEDAETIPTRLCTKAVCIGATPIGGVCRNAAGIVDVAKAYACDAIYPGDRLLSENADFAELCGERGITFIGPSAESIRKIGDKQNVRALMEKQGIPVIYGSDDAERTIENPRYIEVQVLGDRYDHMIHLGERERTVRRKNVRISEEAPARAISTTTRKAMEKAALKAAKAVGLFGAGNVEFVLDQKDTFYFIEIKNGVQEGHPVTEMVTGIDLMREQVCIAAGQKLSIKQDDVPINGCAIECRIKAEESKSRFAYSLTPIGFLHLPSGCGIRVDSALHQGSKINPQYDLELAKVVAYASERQETMEKMRRALEETTIEGINTNLEDLLLTMYYSDCIAEKMR